MHKKSIFHKLLFRIIPISIIPFLATLILLFQYICSSIISEERHFLEQELTTYVQSVQEEKNKAISKSDKLIENNNLNNWLKEKPEKLYDQILLIQQIEKTVTLINDNEHNIIFLYTDNPNILESDVIINLNNLTNNQTILDNLAINSIFFHDSILYDEYNNPFFYLYRKMPLDDTTVIIEIKTYIPASKNIVIAEHNEQNSKSDDVIIQPLTKKLIAVATLNKHNINIKCTKYGFLLFFIGVVFCAITVFTSIEITKKTTDSINTFIKSLSTSTLLDKKVKFDSVANTWEHHVIKTTVLNLIKIIEQNKEAQYKTELSKKRLEIEMLQSKIDPHMLYNSLGTISHEAYISKNENLYTLIKNLTDYYRMVLSHGTVFITIQEEIEMITKYISVNEISHFQKYDFTFNIEESLLNFKIPHMMLQPFIENSIIHGLAGKQQPCIIHLDCYSKNEHIYFKIFDNGYGIEEEKLQKLNNLVQTNENYGILNTFQRMILYFGDGCNIKYTSKPDEYTEALISVPKKQTVL